MPTTPGLQLDLQADALEVVQAIQDLNSSITLVAKPTHLRAGLRSYQTNTKG